MNPHELRIIAELLHRASQEFSNHGCTDFDVAELATPSERKELAKDMARTMGGDYDERARAVQDDWVLMAHFARRCEEEAEEGT